MPILSPCWSVKLSKNKNPWFGATAEWIKKKGNNMCDCNENEDRKVICKGIEDLITVKWDDYSQLMRIKSGDYSNFILTENEAVDLAKTMLMVIENNKIEKIKNKCSHSLNN